MKKTKLGLMIASAALLAACGGGGGSDSGKTVRLNGTEEISVGEGRKISVSTQYSVDSIKAVDADSRLNLSHDGNRLSVFLDVVQSPAIGTYDVYMTSGKNTYIQRYEVMGVNTSAMDIESRAYDIQENYDALLALSEDKKVYQFMVDLAYLDERITPAQRDSRIAQFDAAAQGSYAIVKGDFDTLLSTFNQYLDGKAGESELQGYVTQAEASLATHSAYGLNRLRAVEDLSGPVMTNLPDTEVVFVDSELRFSRYFDSTMLNTDGSAYTTGYEILTPLTGI